MSVAKTLLVLVGLTAIAACSETRAPARVPLASPAPPPVMQQTPGTLLPAGWVWPFAPDRIADAFKTYAIYRPVDVSQLIPAQNAGPCAPTQVAANVWITPLCSALPSLASSPAVRERSLQDRPAGSLPAGVDLRASGLDGPIKNQQMVGICWSFAISTLMDDELRRSGRPEVIAPLHVLSSDTWNRLWSKGRNDQPLVGEPSWPYDPPKGCKLNESKSEVWCEQAYHVKKGSWREDPVLVGEVQRANETGMFRISNIEKLKPSNPDQLAGAIADGQAIYAGFDINRGAWQDPRSGFIPDWSSSDAAHGVALVGYQSVNGRRFFLIHNSWGVTWGDHGYAWVSQEMVKAFVHEAFVINVTAGGQSLPPPVRPPPIPTTGLPLPIPWPPIGGGTTPTPPSSGCASGQVRDMVFGTCISPCPGGSPPVAGLCPIGTSSSPSPNPSPGSKCPQGSVQDWITGACSAQCSNGLPRAAGVCLP